MFYQFYRSLLTKRFKIAFRLSISTFKALCNVSNGSKLKAMAILTLAYQLSLALQRLCDIFLFFYINIALSSFFSVSTFNSSWKKLYETSIRF
jgi:hypothetical protein